MQCLKLKEVSVHNLLRFYTAYERHLSLTQLEPAPYAVIVVMSASVVCLFLQSRVGLDTSSSAEPLRRVSLVDPEPCYKPAAPSPGWAYLVA